MKAVPARPVFWIMLLLTIAGSGGMKLLALRMKQAEESELQIAIYRYPADERAKCQPWLGSESWPIEPTDGDERWVRMQPLTDHTGSSCTLSPSAAM
jgi:hypothetical protein